METVTVALSLRFVPPRPTAEEMQKALDAYRRRKDYARNWMSKKREAKG
jgi:hypothetical protein